MRRLTQAMGNESDACKGAAALRWAERLEARNIERPMPGEVLVRIVCAETKPVDAKLRRDGNPQHNFASTVCDIQHSFTVCYGPGAVLSLSSCGTASWHAWCSRLW
jgi:hypothetical protein